MLPETRPRLRAPLPSLDGASYDVAVIGGGINGACAAQHLAADGFSVLLVDKADFGAGTSSRSGRVMHCGLRNLDRGEPIWNYFRNPGWFLTQCKRARVRMQHRAELVQTVPDRMIPTTLYIPVYRHDHASPFFVSLAFRILQAIGPSSPPLNWRRVPRKAWSDAPLLALSRLDDLDAVFSFTEYLFDWPERLCIDYAMAAERLGAVIRNYTVLIAADRAAGGEWRLKLADTAGENETATVTAHQVVNTTGPWVDEVSSVLGKPTRKFIAGTKGSWIAAKLPEDCRGHGLATFNSIGYPFYFLPWSGYHYIGPTETRYEGEVDAVAATEEEIEFLIREADRAMPGLRLRRTDVLFAWAGVRPMPHIPGYQGKQNLDPEIHDLASEGLPGFMNLAGGALMVHRMTARKIASFVRGRIASSRPRSSLRYGSRIFSADDASPPLLSDYPNISLRDLQDIARNEKVLTLADLLFRRTGLAWNRLLTLDELRAAARAVAPELGWDESQVELQIVEYQSELRELFRT